MISMDGIYKIHLSDEKNKFVVIRSNHPHLMIYISYSGNQIEISRILLMENCSPSVLSKVLMEFELYFKGEIFHRIQIDEIAG